MGFALVVIIGKLAKTEVSLKVFLQEDLLVHVLCRKFIYIWPKTFPYMKVKGFFLGKVKLTPIGELVSQTEVHPFAGEAISVDY